MKINWTKSISTKVNAGMLGILFSLFSIAFISFWMITKFNALSSAVSEKHLQELSKSAELHLIIKNIHHKMDKLVHADNKIGNRLDVQHLIASINQLSLTVRDMPLDSDSQVMGVMIQELLPIVNAYSLHVDHYLTLQSDLRVKIELLDKLYFKELKKQRFRGANYNEKLNLLYVITRSLADQPTTFRFRKATKQVERLINQLQQTYSARSELFDVILNAETNGIVGTLADQYKIKLNLSVLNTQTDVLIEQLTSMSFEKMTALNKLVSASTQELYETSNKFIKLLTWIVLFTTLFTLVLMLVFNRTISKKLMLIANSLGKEESKSILKQQTDGQSEISIIAKAMLKNIERNEYQRNEITAKNKQLMLVIDNSQQAIIIYCDDKIVYSNEYCNQVLELNDYENTDIVSQNLLMAISTKTADDRLHVGDKYFKFFATNVEWNGKKSTLALLTDITDVVEKESQLIEKLEIVKDESLTDTLTGLYNRRKLELFLEQNSSLDYVLIIADIDWFKEYNDHYGHAQGDICIRMVSDILKQSLRTGDDLAIRYGGEEFVILLLNSSIEKAKSIILRIQKKISGLAIKHEKSMFSKLTLSFGVAHSDEFAKNSWKQLFDKADKRLYRAKQKGRNTLVYQDDLQ